MRLAFWIVTLCWILFGCNPEVNRKSVGSYNHQIDSLIQEMTLYEKVGQMYQCLGRGHARVGDGQKARDLIELVKAGGVGSILVPGEVDDVEEMQRFAVEETRLGVPLFFNYDVIHGFKTIFPIPLAMSCSWDTAMVRQSHAVAALEAASAGISYNHGPMLDVSRDPRWGRVMEGNGEDPYLSSLMTRAAIQGFQGNNLKDPATIIACAKHFIGYGAVEGGRDYNTVDFGNETLYNIHLPPFIAAIEENVGSVMTSFNVVESVPTVAHQKLLKNLLRNDLAFDGIVISDFGSVGELIKHGYAMDNSQATSQAISATVDIEMQSRNYHQHIKQLVEKGVIDEVLIDSAVRRILQKKFELGLFDNPYRFSTPGKIQNITLSHSHRKKAKESAMRSMVLLKNNGLLPIKEEVKKIAVIGPFANSKDILGRWSAKGDTIYAVSLVDGLKDQFPGCEINFLGVGDFWEDKQLPENRIKRLANSADLVLLALGEPKEMSAEAASRANLTIPGNQDRIAEIVKQAGKPIALVLFNGRPLTIDWYQDHVDAILEVWYPGTEGGNAIAQVLAGEYNPSGKLTMTFPRAVGQIPIYYNHYNTGRPASSSSYSSKYIDITNGPLYPFGFGLSYSSFEYSDITLTKNALNSSDEITATVNVMNTGDYVGEEIVQLYIRDHVGEIVRPVKELKGFRKVSLNPSESKEISFKINSEMLRYWSPVSKDYVVESGTFSVMIGPNSSQLANQTFELTLK